MRAAVAIALLSLAGSAAGKETVSLSLPGASHAALVFADSRPTVGALPLELAARTLREVDHLWVWSPTCPVQRVEPEQLSTFRCRPAAAFVEVKLLWPGQPRAARPRGALRAAPPELWREVEEALLPAWSIGESGAARVPSAGGSLRLRFAGETHGSAWRDVPVGMRGVEMPIEEAVSPRVRVIDEGGDVLGAATLSIAEPGPASDRPLAYVAAEDDGTLPLVGLPAHLPLVLFANAVGALPLRLETVADRVPREIRLMSGCRLIGTIEDESGVPLPQVELRAEAYHGEGTVVASAATSDAQGRFDLGPLPTGSVVVGVRREGRASLTLRLDLAECRRRWDAGRISLAPARALVVAVVDDRGSPVAGAEVRAVGGAAAWSDAEGRARLDDLDPDAGAMLSVRARGHGKVEQPLLPPLPDELRVELERQAHVRGQLVDEHGAPPAGAEVRVVQGGSFHESEVAGDGTFSVPLPAHRAHELVFRSPSTLDLSRSVAALAPGEELDLGILTAPSGQTVVGRLLYAETMEPVVGAKVWSVREGGGPGAVVAWALGETVSTTSDGDGSFRLSGLRPGPASLRIERAGLAPHDVDARPGEDDGGPIDVGDVLLSPGATVQVTGDFADGSLARLDWKGRDRDMDSIQSSFVAGEAWLRNVPAGSAVVRVVAGRRHVCEEALEVPEGGGQVAVACEERPLEVTGMVRVGGRPSGRGSLLWLDGPDGDSLVLARRSHLGATQTRLFGAGRGQVEVAVEDDGSFATTELLPGEWHVLWRPEGGGGGRGRVVEVYPGHDVALLLDFSPHVLAGRVVDQRGEPVAGARVLELEGRGADRTDEAGRFRLLDVEPGLLRVQARAGDMQSAVALVELPPDRPPEPLHLTLEADDGDRLELRVVGADGAATGGFAFVEGDRQGLHLLALDATGQARLRLLPPLPQRVRAAAVAGARVALGEWVPLERALEEGVELTFGDGGELEVESERRQAVSLVAIGGWDVSAIYRHLGIPTVAGPGAPLRLTGLPPGRYRIAAGEEERWVDLGAGDLKHARFAR